MSVWERNTDCVCTCVWRLSLSVCECECVCACKCACVYVCEFECVCDERNNAAFLKNRNFRQSQKDQNDIKPVS